jgi:hypothetical protein
VEELEVYEPKFFRDIGVSEENVSGAVTLQIYDPNHTASH